MSPGILSPAEARLEFPVAEEVTYANVSVNGLIPRRTRDLAIDYVERRSAGRISKAEVISHVEKARHLFARLVRAHDDEIATVKNVSEGINLIAGSLAWERGDNVVVCQELEHPSNVFPWHNQARRLGVEVRAVPSDGARIPVGRMIDAMDGRTRLLTAPTVGFSPGFRTPTRELSDACRERGVFFLLDAAQSVGILRSDVGELGADALAVATQKGLMAFYGAGFLYCRREVAEALLPPSLGRYGVKFGPGVGESSTEEQEFEYASGARRFDSGNYNYLGFAAAAASLSLIHDVGVDTVENHAVRLGQRAAEGLASAGLPVCGGVDAPDRAHIVTVGEPGAGGHDSAADPTIQELFDFLTARGVVLSIRRGVLRLSFHVYNNDADVDRIVGLVQEWAAARS